ncbi:hypothetical protein GCM10010452_45200 [Crossiella cryophila]
MVGTFLPWLRSGEVLRDSYAAVGVLGRVSGLADGAVGPLLAVWPGVGIVAALCVVAYVTGFVRTAAVANVLFAAICGVMGGFAAFHVHGGTALGLVWVGPVVTVLGAVLGVLGGVAVLVAPIDRDRRHRRTISEHTV